MGLDSILRKKNMLKSYTVLQKTISNTKKDLKYHSVCLQTPQHSQDLMLGGKIWGLSSLPTSYYANGDTQWSQIFYQDTGVYCKEMP